MKRKCINIAVVVAFLVTGLLVTGSAFGQTETDARNNAPTSLHTTLKGMEIFYTTDGSHPDFIGSGYETLTGVPYNTLGCKDCHAASNPPPYTDPDACDKCHTDLVTFTDAIPNTTCAGCHGRQNKEAAKGFTDVHSTAYPNCADCHTWTDLHGDGTAYNSMLEPGAVTTSCEDCHTGTSPVGPAVDASHDPHAGKLHCSACHVKSVITCYNCHFDSEVDGFGKIANTALGANDKDAGFVLLMNDANGQVRTATYQSLVYDGNNEFVAYAPFHGHSVGTGADARTCDDCHMNDNIIEYNTTGKIVLTSWNGSAIVQEATGAIPLIDGAMELAFVDLLSRSPNVWGSMSSGTGTVQYGFGTPLTVDQLNAMSHQPPPPVMQQIGFYDVEFDGLGRDDCIVCHTNTVDGHHLLYGDAIPLGLCSYANGTCSEDGVTPCIEDTDCTGTCDPVTPGTCLSSEDCAQPLYQCNINGQPCPVGTCTGDGTTPCEVDDDCAVAGGTCDAGPCPQSWTGQICDLPVCYGESAIVDTDADSSGTPDTNYGCLNCHEQDNSGGVISFVVERDCTVCHVQGLNQPTVHHANALGEAKNAVCTTCHGDVVDDALGCAETTQDVCSSDLDGVLILCEDDTICTTLGIGTCVSAGGCDHDTPTYEPSMVTPAPSSNALICQGAWGGSGDPCADDTDCSGGETCEPAGDALPGGCNYCHDAGLDMASGKDIHDNYDTHHHSGIYKNKLGGSNDDICLWCHPTGHPHHTSCSNDRSIEDCEDDSECPPGGECQDPEDSGFAMRGCEVCHGYESLHNIQNDSLNPDNIGTIVVGGEDVYWGHIGRDNPTNPDNDSDCWGCHGFSISSDPKIGAIIPSLSTADKDTIVAGVATALTLKGVAFTNEGYTSIVEVLAGDDVVATVIPDSISVNSLDCNLPALGAGNYKVRVRKDDVVSNPVAVKCIPGVTIDSVTCEGGVLTVTGSGFGVEPPEGAEDFINVKMGAMSLEIIEWSDTQITASTAICGDAVTVNALYGSASLGEDCCKGNFDADTDVDGTDAALFKTDFGRNGINNACAAGNACNGNFDCDSDVDGTDAALFKANFGRNGINNPCTCSFEGCYGE